MSAMKRQWGGLQTVLTLPSMIPQQGVIPTQIRHQAKYLPFDLLFKSNGNPLIFSQVAFSVPDTKARKLSPQRRRNGDLALLDTNATASEVTAKEHLGSDGDAWALPKGEKRWSVASVM